MIAIHSSSSAHKLLFAMSVSAAAASLLHAQEPLQLSIHWDKTAVVSKSTPTLQVVVNPPLRPGEPLNNASYKAAYFGENLMGLQPHRSDDTRLSCRDRRPSYGDEL